MSHTIDLKVEYTNKLAQENEALRAQVELLRGVANDAIHFATNRKGSVCADPMFTVQQLQNRLEATPAQCLAEIKAQAVEDASEALYKSGLTDAYVSDWLVEYANKIHQAAKDPKQ